MKLRIHHCMTSIVATVTIALVAACSSSPGSSPATAKPKLGSSPYYYKFFINSGGKKTQVNVAPQEVAYPPPTPSAQPILKGQAITGQSDVRALDTPSPKISPLNVPAPDGGGDVLVTHASTSDLITGAAAQCGMIGDIEHALLNYTTYTNDPALEDIVSEERNGQTINALTAVYPPWPQIGSIAPVPPAYYIFNPAPQYCDQVLEYEETIVCIADQLAQLADTVGPLTWHAPLFLQLSDIAADNIVEPVTWTMPPPDEATKFVVRDLALSVLAHIPMLDSYPMATGPIDGMALPMTCSGLYAAYDQETTKDTVLQNMLFGPRYPGTTYPPLPDAMSMRTIAQERQAFEAGVLRGAGQLLHDLVRESVYSDLAGAAALAAATGDQQGGQVTASGIDGQAPYNSLAHVARTLLGRWEVDPSDPDPECSGVPELGLLPDLADQGEIAQINDLSALTSSQSLAETLLEESGIVVPDGTSVDQGTLTNQIAAIKGAATGTEQQEAISALVQTLGPSDLARASLHNRTTFTLLTGVSTKDPTQFAAAAKKAGLVVLTSSALTTPGVVIAGGLPRAWATTDPTARLGSLVAGSECQPINGMSEMLFDDTVLEAPVAAKQYFPSFPGTFFRQDVFALGQGIRSRLVKLREYADKSAPTTSSSSADARARAAAVGELGAWAGAGRAVLSTNFGDTAVVNQYPGTIYLDLIGVSPSDFGANQLTDLTTSVSLVVGDPKLAECAAHLTSIPCDPIALAAATMTATAATTDTFGATAPTSQVLRQRYGMTGGFVRLHFTPSAAVTNPNLPFNGWQQTFYVVLTKDSTHGVVLATLTLPVSKPVHRLAWTYGEASMTLSPMRNELTYDAFGLGKWVGAAPPQAGERPVSGTPTFCVENVPRDIFVPLQNDLTDSTGSYENSWSHYLSLAQEAATNADAIGQQLLDVGFQRDQTIENAAEQVLAASGAPFNVNDVKIDADGNIDPGPSNAVAAATVNQPTLDVVLFGKDPATSNPQVIETAIGCPTAAQQMANPPPPDNPICDQLAKLNPGDVVDVPLTAVGNWTRAPSVKFAYTALNIANQQVQSGPQANCQNAVLGVQQIQGVVNANGVANSLFDATAFSGAIQNLSEDSVLAGLSNTKMVIDDYLPDGTTYQPGHWQVNYNGSPIMDSDVSTPLSPVWPACLKDMTCNFNGPNPLNGWLNDMFRHCPNGATRTTPLGQCEGGGGIKGATNLDAELNGIRWRVEGALWLAGAMSGEIPANMFSGPMPAVNFPSNANTVTAGTALFAPINTFFANGTFQPVTQGLMLSPGMTSPAQAMLSNTFVNSGGPLGGELLNGTYVDPTSRYTQWGNDDTSLLPAWLQTIYFANQPGPTPSFDSGDQPEDQSNGNNNWLVHVFGNNEDGLMDFTDLQPFFNSAFNGGAPSSQIAPTMWSQLGTLLQGQQCVAPGGGNSYFDSSQTIGGIKSTGANWLSGLVGAVKTHVSTQSNMMKIFTGCPGGCNAGQTDLIANTWKFDSTAGDFYPTNGVQVSQGGPLVLPGDSSLTMAVNGVPSYQFWGVAFAGVPQYGPYATYGLLDNARFPDVVTPNERLPFALNSGAPKKGCEAAWQLAEAMALSCIVALDAYQDAPPPVSEPLQVTSTGQLAALAAWVRGKLNGDVQQLSHFYVAHVPAAVVANAMNVPGSVTGASGKVGQDVIQASNALLNIYSDWNNVLKDAQLISGALDQASNQLNIAAVQLNEDEVNQDIKKLTAIKSIADDVINIAAGAALMAASALPQGTNLAPNAAGEVQGAAEAAHGAADLVADGAILGDINQLMNDPQLTYTDNVNAALNALNQATVTNGAAMASEMISLREDINNLQAGASAFASDRASLSYYMGKATGADVWNCNVDGQAAECSSRVNTVLNRRYDGTQIRYQAALQNAKGLAYLARLSIEQRIGVRLNDLTTPIGTLDAPSVWADDVCHLTGINYNQLTSLLPDAGTQDQVMAADQAVAAQFADAFIGDYTQKLADFVQYYNVAFPEQDGNDTAVLSLRESLLGGKGTCRGTSANLLADSSRLDLASRVWNVSTTGWVFTGCAPSDQNCTVLRNKPLSPPVGPGSVTWLDDVPTASTGDAGTEAGTGGGAGAGSGLPPGAPDDSVVQQVLLNTPGTYVLSWWDRALDPQLGTETATPVPPYQVNVFDSTWHPVTGTGYSQAPNASTDPSIAGWSPRLTRTFTITQPDVYYVAIAASAFNGTPGSVAIANVQLELVAGSGDGASPYVDTNSAGQATLYNCAASSADLLAAFVRTCDPDGTCYYDLTTPITLNTQNMSSNGMSLAGKLAAGNFNFRHIDVALNVVGTGVIDCSGTGSPDCFGSGYLQYTLQHDATDIGVLGYNGQYRPFDFGVATINHAKAVTAERYITTPIGSADQGLINQFLAVQFRGRPMDGTYHLRIYDTPAFRFNNMQDIQFILNYHYWSPVSTGTNSN